MSNGIAVSSSLQGHDVTRCLLQRRRTQLVMSAGATAFDYRCGLANVIVCDDAFISEQTSRQTLSNRLSEAKWAAGAARLVLIVWMTTTEPALGMLSWLNVECGLQLQCGVILCWTVEEVAQTLESLAAASVLSVDYNARKPQVVVAPLPVLIDSLTQTPQILNRNDVVRIANRKRCVADVLAGHAAEFDNIPGLGAKKLSRVEALFQTPFLTSRQNVQEVVAQTTSVTAASRSTPTQGYALMQAALERLQSKEDGESS